MVFAIVSSTNSVEDFEKKWCKPVEISIKTESSKSYF